LRPFLFLQLYKPVITRCLTNLTLWNCKPDGAPIITRGSHLLPVIYNDSTPAMLKVAHEAEERRGGLLMIWWNGKGAANVLAHDDNALLLERATGKASLLDMAHRGHDDEASRIMCKVAAKLHAPQRVSPPHLIPLTHWFASLFLAGEKYGGMFQQATLTARKLLNAPQDTTILHGDIHHQNILDFGTRGWLAIDPKGLAGERGFDFANIFCNPDMAIATTPGRLTQQVTIVADAAHLHSKRLLQWILAYAGLSAAWSLEDGYPKEAALTLEIAAIASAEITKQ